MSIDLASIGRELKKPVENIETAVKLLDEGNTIPFITRFRKDQTGGLTEDQLATIKASVTRLRALLERKAFISKSIESQGKLDDAVRSQIDSARSTRELEDVYLPFKPKKQTLATVARQNGLEPLAMDIFEGREPEKALAERATDFVRVDKNLNSVDEVIAGVKYILAEKFSDNTTLRNELREIISKGKLTTRIIEVADNSHEPNDTIGSEPKSDADSTDQKTVESPTKAFENSSKSIATTDSSPIQKAEVDVEKNVTDPEADTATLAGESSSHSDQPQDSAEVSPAIETETVSEEKVAVQKATEDSADSPEDATKASSEPKKGKSKKKKKKKKTEDPYKEFDDFSHAIAKMQYYKTLAINRGEKMGRLKVKIHFDEDEFLARANKQLVPEDHPFKEFLHECVKDGMSRLVAPSLERETRREITEAAEKHAVQVFARNLKNLMLQSPVRDHRVLSIDPGYKRGCSVAVLDQGGQLLASDHVFVVGNEKRRVESKEKLAQLINEHQVSVIAIGNGAACREAEQMISDMLVESFADRGLKYSMVNEAGASFYSTSEVGREDFPDLSPAIRSAVSIGRRLMDPLSELVKISPANIGVGLYQHDVKAKHLAESLDEVVQFCVNRVGVDVNTASTSLLKYVSGLNQLTARRVFEYREENGPFKNREQLKQVSGFGDATFVQSAGFLRVRNGDHPLDNTSVHPENYEIANRIFERVNASVDELFPVLASPVATQKVNIQKENSTAADASADTSDSDPSNVAVAGASGSAIAENSENVQTGESTDIAAQTNPQPVEEESTAQEAQCQAEEVKKAVPQPAAASIPKLSPEQIKRRKEIVKAIRDLDIDQIAKEFGVGRLLMQDIVHSICRPEHDPRNNVNRPVFRSGIIKIDDLTKEMQLDGQVVNVVDFGVFVDIGLGTSCLVHVSQLANHYIRDPHRFYAVGDSLRVWVTEVESEQRRVKLTAVQPKSLRPPRRQDRKPGKPSGKPYAKRGNQGTKHQFKQKRKAKPKPIKPITDDMLTGAEPMRSFSDLAQFFNKQSDSEGDDKK